jgi:mannose-6-phosphate isomerase-like protein (cupin superfamily)
MSSSTPSDPGRLIPEEHGKVSTVRRLVIGADSTGRSYVIEEAEFCAPDSAPPMEVIHQTMTTPPPVRAPGNGEYLDLHVPPGIARWMLVQFTPDQRSRVHHTDTIDFDTIISGSVDILLDDGPHHLGPGDCVLVPGVDHAWLAGPEGCTSSVVVIGTPPRD